MHGKQSVSSESEFCTLLKELIEIDLLQLPQVAQGKATIHAPGQAGQAKKAEATSKQKANSITGLKKGTCAELCSEPFKWQSFNNFNEDK